eukprot:3256193-Pyramimonas_sp.AAC.2
MRGGSIVAGKDWARDVSICVRKAAPIVDSCRHGRGISNNPHMGVCGRKIGMRCHSGFPVPCAPVRCE